MKCTPKDMQNIAELWHRAHSLMIERAAPAEVSEVAAEALTSTASLCGFSAPNFVEYMILKQQQCVPSLPCTVLLRVKFGEIAHFGLAQAMWGYDALPQPALLLQVQGRYASLQEAGLAWEVHYQEMHAHSTPELQPSIDGIIQTFAFGFMEYLQLANQSIIDDSHP